MMLPCNQWMFSGDGAEFGAVICQALIRHCTHGTVGSLKRINKAEHRISRMTSLY